MLWIVTYFVTMSIILTRLICEVRLSLCSERYFRCGDVDALRHKMERLSGRRLTEIEKRDMRKLIAKKYNWNKIAEQTIEVYGKVMGLDNQEF